MINVNLSLTQPGGFAMPVCGRERVASVRVLRDATQAAAVKGAVPGPHAWSPPI